jgi:hypothetical protein
MSDIKSSSTDSGRKLDFNNKNKRKVVPLNKKSSGKK